MAYNFAVTFAERKKKSEDIAKRQEAKAVKVNIKKALYKREAIDKAIQAKREGRLERLSEAGELDRFKYTNHFPCWLPMYIFWNIS